MLIVNKNRYSAVEYWYSMCINIYLPFWQLIYSICGMVFEWTVQIRLQWTGSGTMERKRSWYLLNPILDGFLHCKWTMNFLFLGQHPLCQTPLVSCLLPFLIQCFFLLPLIPHSFLRLHRNIKTGTEKFKKKSNGFYFDKHFVHHWKSLWLLWSTWTVCLFKWVRLFCLTFSSTQMFTAVSRDMFNIPTQSSEWKCMCGHQGDFSHWQCQVSHWPRAVRNNYMWNWLHYIADIRVQLISTLTRYCISPRKKQVIPVST